MSPRHAGSAEAKNDNNSTTEALATASLGDTTRRQVATHVVMCEQQQQEGFIDGAAGGGRCTDGETSTKKIGKRSEDSTTLWRGSSDMATSQARL
jgi:anti-sigma factor ChrR (cupin superfamily)